MPCRGKFASYDEEFVSKLVKAGVSINIIFDVGASNGWWSAEVSKAAPEARFELFEPLDSPQYAEVLANVLAQHPQFRMHRIALGSENTTLRLNIYASHDGNSLIDSDWEGVKDKTPVPVRRLDDYIRERGLSQPDIIKMDVQGFELNALKGGEQTCRNTKALILETWLYPGYGPTTPLLHELIAWLAERNFSVVAFGDAYVAPDLKLTCVDAFFVRQDVAAQIAATGEGLVFS